MTLKEYEVASYWRKVRWHLPTLFTAFSLGSIVYAVGIWRQSKLQIQLTEPQFVPIYDGETGKLLGMTHPVLVEKTEQKRQRDVAAKQNNST